VDVARGHRTRRFAGWIAWAVVGVTGVAGSVWLARWTPDPDPAATVCLLRRVTGADCPGCGMGRAAAALVRADWVLALRLHPLSVPLAIESVVAWVVWAFALAGRIRRPGGRFWLLLGGVHAAAFLAVWVVRGLF
jgi:hypothetical protein